jgi:hypothetical protein
LKQKLKKINWLVVAQIVLVLGLSVMPLFAANDALAQTNPLTRRFNPPCSSGLNCETTTLNQLIERIIKILLGVAFAIAVLFLIIGGFYYITARGNEEQSATGRQTVINALIGIVIIIMAYVLVNVVANLAFNSGDSGI